MIPEMKGYTAEGQASAGTMTYLEEMSSASNGSRTEIHLEGGNWPGVQLKQLDGGVVISFHGSFERDEFLDFIEGVAVARRQPHPTYIYEFSKISQMPWPPKAVP